MNDLFDAGEMEELLSQINANNINKANDDTSSNAMTKEMEASQRRYEEILKKHANDNL